MTGYFATALLFIGIYLIGRRKRFGFILCFLGEVGWLIRGLECHLIDLMVLSVVFASLQIWNYWKWGRPEKPPVLLFSKRVQLARAAEAWMDENHARFDTLGVITALQALGVDLRRPESK